MNIDNTVKTKKKSKWAPEYDRKYWMDRVQGITGLSISSIFVYYGIKENMPFFTVAGALVATDGAGDLITGYHHYVGQKAIEGYQYLKSRLKK